MQFLSLDKRMKIAAFYKKKGIKKTQRKFGVGNSQIKSILASLEAVKKTVDSAVKKDLARSSKRKGPSSHAEERRARKKQRLGKAGAARGKKHPQYLYLDQKILEWYS